MLGYATKRQVNHGRTGKDQRSQRTSRNKATAHFVDDRPKAVPLRTLQELADKTSHTQNAAQVQAMVNQSPAMVAQRKHIARMFGGTAQQRGMSVEDEKSLARGPVIQGEFKPVTTTHNAHLRNRNQWGQYVGNRIDSRSEIVVDRADTEQQSHLIGANTIWTRAVNVTANDWDWGQHGGRNTYIRSTRLGADKRYPRRANAASYKPPNRDTGYGYQRNWNPRTGEYVTIEDSVSHAGAMVVYHKGHYYRLAQNGQIQALDAEERLQLSTPALKQHLHDRLVGVLADANDGKHWKDILATRENAATLMADTDGSKALRFKFGSLLAGNPYVAWYKWATADDGPFSRIQEGAEFVCASLEHWREWLYPGDRDRVKITSIKLTGSDLHEAGLGVMFVKFTKPAGRNADYNAQGEHEVVIKPEARVLEKALFGTQGDSLANVINRVVGLAPENQIAIYKQAVDQQYGTLCEKVVATQADKLGEHAEDISQAMKEALVFVLITGMTDLHGENVLWDEDGKPYMIDADNALKLQYMTRDMPAQNGFKLYAGARTDETVQGVMSSAVGYETEMMKELINPSSRASKRLLSTVHDIFAQQTGRTVPIETAVWGNRLRVFIMCVDEGAKSDDYIEGQEQTTRWRWCDYWATTVPTGKGANAPGLEGEVGKTGGGNFQQDAEKDQLHADFKVGQIPFYTYQYGTGFVYHNGVHIWDGHTVGDRMRGLFELFPNQQRT